MEWSPRDWKPSRGRAQRLLADSIVSDIREGRLRAGDALPGSRVLASALDLHRNSIVAVYEELCAQGWLESESGSGTFVSPDLPKTIADAPPCSLQPSYRLRDLRNYDPLISRDCRYDMSGGIPDTRLVPRDAIARHVRAATREGSLDYGDPRGALPLRTQLANLLRQERGLLIDPDQVLVTQGSQMAIALAGMGLLDVGDRVAVEAIGYRPAWQALQMSGACLHAVPVDGEGLDVDALMALHRTQPLKAVYLTPHHQFPTLVTLSAARRLALLRFARAEGIAILEDDYDHEFHYEGRPVLPMAANDTSGNVLYIGTLSKLLAPAIRVGYLVAPRDIVEALARIRHAIDGQGPTPLQLGLASWIAEGELGRHARRVRKHYQRRRKRLVEALSEHFGDALRFTVPPGGMALWIEALGICDVERFADTARAEGVRISTARGYRFDRQAAGFLRIGFGRVTPDEISEAIAILAKLPR